MANVLAVSMVYFPYLLIGLGQAIIVGTRRIGRAGDDSVKAEGCRIHLVTSLEKTNAASAKERDISGYPVFSPY